MPGLELGDPRAQRVVQAVGLGFGIAFALESFHGDLLWTDGQAYWDAAVRVRAGAPVYPAMGNADATELFRYAPWFAWAWVPLTFLPEAVAAAGWTVLMIAAWAVPVVAFLRLGWQARALAFLAAPALLVAALGGNVQPAVVALLFLGLESRWGPAAIGVAASLKLFPVLFAVVYVGRREWRRATLAILLAALLWLPALALGLDTYPTGIGGALSLFALSPLLYALAVIAILGWTLLRPNWRLASSSVIVASAYRFIPYQLGYLLCSRPRSGVRPPAPASGSNTAASTG